MTGGSFSGSDLLRSCREKGKKKKKKEVINSASKSQKADKAKTISWWGPSCSFLSTMDNINLSQQPALRSN
jgi:hypothetical protein